MTVSLTTIVAYLVVAWGSASLARNKDMPVFGSILFFLVSILFILHVANILVSDILYPSQLRLSVEGEGLALIILLAIVVIYSYVKLGRPGKGKGLQPSWLLLLPIILIGVYILTPTLSGGSSTKTEAPELSLLGLIGAFFSSVWSLVTTIFSWDYGIFAVKIPGIHLSALQLTTYILIILAIWYFFKNFHKLFSQLFTSSTQALLRNTFKYCWNVFIISLRHVFVRVFRVYKHLLTSKGLSTVRRALQYRKEQITSLFRKPQ